MMIATMADSFTLRVMSDLWLAKGGFKVSESAKVEYWSAGRGRECSTRCHPFGSLYINQLVNESMQDHKPVLKCPFLQDSRVFVHIVSNEGAKLTTSRAIASWIALWISLPTLSSKH